MNEGLSPASRYESFSNLRENVVYCWLSPDDQKIFNSDEICLEICVNEERCIVADMDYISLAMMYKCGGIKYGGKNIPVNLKAAELCVKLYEVTSSSLFDCERDVSDEQPTVLQTFSLVYYTVKLAVAHAVPV